MTSHRQVQGAAAHVLAGAVQLTRAHGDAARAAVAATVCASVAIALVVGSSPSVRTGSLSVGAGASLHAAATYAPPMYFVENRGVAPESVAYYAHGSNSSLSFDDRGFNVVQTAGPDQLGKATVRIDFVGANAVAPQADGTQGPPTSYFIGQQENWKPAVPTTDKLVYRNLWNGVDLVVDGSSGKMKSTFEVAAGGDPNQIKLAYRGADVSLDADGNLIATTPLGGLSDSAPVAWQLEEQASVGVEYLLAHQTDETVVTFGVGDYDHNLPLSIDPTIVSWANLIGGPLYDGAIGVDADETGVYVGMYVSGTVTSFPDIDPGEFWDDTYNGGTWDAYVAKLALDGLSVIYATYIGGSGGEGINSIAVDEDGSAYFVGNGPSADYPTTAGAFDTTQNGTEDVVLTKLSPDGTALEYSTFIGGSAGEQGMEVAVDDAGRAYVVGSTASTETTFPDGNGFGLITAGPDQVHNGGTTDVFIIRISADGSTADYAGYIGGSDVEPCCSIKVSLDSNNNAYVSSKTSSSQATFPDGDDNLNNAMEVPGYDQTFGDGVTLGNTQDAFIVEVGGGVDETLGETVFATYLGGATTDSLGSVLVTNGSIYAAGWTNSDETTFFAPAAPPASFGPDTTHNGDSDVYLARLSLDGDSLLAFTYYGGSGEDGAEDFEVDSNGDLYVALVSASTEATLPLADGPDLDYNGGDYDGVFAKFDPDTFVMEYAGYVGGSGGDGFEWVYDLAVTAPDVMYGVFETNSTDTTLPNGYGFYSIPGMDQTDAGDMETLVVQISQVPAGIPVVESGGSTNISEVGPTSDDYTVVLESRPTFNVTVSITPNAQQTTDKSSLTFTPLNWDVPQVVTVTAVNDGITECAHTGLITHAASSTDLNYDGFPVASVVPNITEAGCTSAESDPETVRVACGSPTELSLCISQTRFGADEARAVIIARDDLIVDAFTGTPFASLLEAPILLTPSDHLDPRVGDEALRVLPSLDNPIFILGREAAVQPAVYDALRNLGFTNLVQIGGIHRRETATKIGEEIIARQSGTHRVFLTEDLSLIDTLGAGAAAGNTTDDGVVDPIVLNQRGASTIDPFTDSFLKAHPQITEVELVGSDTALDSSIDSTLDARYPQLTSIFRSAGANRFVTNAALAARFFPSPDGVVVSNGEPYALPGATSVTTSSSGSGLFAALLAGALAADNADPLLVVRQNSVPASIITYLIARASTIDNAVIIGDFAQVSQAVESLIASLI